MLPPLVTVIVAGRDVATLSPLALDSLIAQTQPRWRAIVVDDGSLDETGEIFHEYATRDDRFHVLHNAESEGLGAARNRALDLVDTEFVAFLDADDVLRPRMLDVALTSLDLSGSDLAVGAYVRLSLADGAWRTGEVQPWVHASVAPNRSGLRLDDHPAVVGNIVAWSKVSRRTLWERTNTRFPEGVMYEDQVVAQRLYTSAQGIDLLDEVFVEWRIRHDGTSITQREADPRVLVDCVSQMAEGLAILGRTSALAAAARTSQIVRMDIPRLAEQARSTPESRSVLAQFARTLRPTEEDRPLPVWLPSRPDDTDVLTVGEIFDRVISW